MAHLLLSAFITLNLSLSLIPLSPPVVLADGTVSQESEATVIAISEDKASLTARLSGQALRCPRINSPLLRTCKAMTCWF